jgi:hypothetical protein
VPRVRTDAGPLVAIRPIDAGPPVAIRPIDAGAVVIAGPVIRSAIVAAAIDILPVIVGPCGRRTVGGLCGPRGRRAGPRIVVVRAIAAMGFVAFGVFSAILIGLGHRWRCQYKAQRRGH